MLKLLEGANGTLAFLLIFACFMFGVYMAREILENGVKRVRLQAAISLFVAFAPPKRLPGSGFGIGATSTTAARTLTPCCTAQCC
ncbi:hypothetical protein AB7M45_007784 [Bradyrhizobium elkanii]